MALIDNLRAFLLRNSEQLARSGSKFYSERLLPRASSLAQNSRDKLHQTREKTRLLFSGNLDFAGSELSKLFNRATGYTHCEFLRQLVRERNDQYAQLRGQLSEAKKAYESAVQERSLAQRELNSLLQKKHLWNDTEVERFTELYRSEIRLEQNEASARTEYNDREKMLETAHNQLMDAIRERYQEEQMWSDKIRRASTIGTFSLMGINLAIFLILQVVYSNKGVFFFKQRCAFPKIGFSL